MAKRVKMLSSEGANALRDLAQKLPQCIINIDNSTNELLTIINANSEDLGIRAEDFVDIAKMIKSASDEANQSVAELPALMNEKAEEIDRFVAATLSI